MSLRHSWKGYLKLSLVAVPVKAFPAAVSGTDLHLNQLHASCKSRIQYKKTCPLHGEVPNEDIVSGYEFAKGQYVVVDAEELDKLRSESDKAITIDAFIAAGSLDPLYASARNHYLLPDGPVAEKSYAVLWRGMFEEKRQAIAQVVMHGKEQLVWLRPLDGLLLMTQLHYDAQITKPAELASKTAKTEPAPEELKLLCLLIAAKTPKRFDFAKYRDQYTQKLAQLIEAKVAGQEIVAAPAVERMQVIDLMEALKASVAKTQEPTPEGKPTAKAATKRKKKAAAF